MKDLFKEIKRNDHRIEVVERWVEDINTMHYHEVFGTETERKTYLSKCNDSMKAHLDLRQVLLENLQLEINKELNRVSQGLRACTLLKIA